MAILSKLSYALVFGAAAVYATEDAKKESPSVDHDDADFDDMSGEPAGDDEMPGMGGAPGEAGAPGEEMPDMEAMFKLDTNCENPATRKEGGCKEGQKWVQKAFTAETTQFVGYGCSSSDFMAQMLGKDSAEKSKAEDCCLKRDIAMQTCGATKPKIEESFEACLVDKCGDEKDCPFQAKMGPVMEQMMGGEEGPCKAFYEANSAQCECVDEAEAGAKWEAFVTSFNENHGTSYNAADGAADQAKFTAEMVWEAKDKALKMEKKADPFGNMGGMGGMDGGEGGAGAPEDLDGDDDGSVEESDGEEEVEVKEDGKADL